MPNCTPSVARQGWKLYQASTPPPSLTEINEALELSGDGPVSSRTYRHYRKLAAHKLRDYLPINELDVRLKLGE
jgi:hypothetical protein